MAVGLGFKVLVWAWVLTWDLEWDLELCRRQHFHTFVGWSCRHPCRRHQPYFSSRDLKQGCQMPSARPLESFRYFPELSP